MRDAFAATLVELASKDPSIELLTADLGFGVLRPFQERFPDRFHNVGIAEQLLIEMATGMAMAGKKVVCYSIGNFPALRCLEQIRNDVAYGKQNVKIVEVGGGYTYGQLGMSHNALEDLAAILPIPYISVFTPSDKCEAIWATKTMMETDGATFIRLERPSDKTIHDGPIMEDVGMGLLPVSPGQGAAIVSYGGIAVIAKEVAGELGYAFFSAPRIKPLDEARVKAQLGSFPRIVVIEEHSRIGGLGAVLSSMMGRVTVIGTPDGYAPFIGDQDYMRTYVGLSKEELTRTLRGEK